MGSENNMVAVPEGMVAWHGGEEPADWDGGRVLTRDGSIYLHDNTSEGRWVHGYLGRSDLDIVAYTPARLASPQPDAQQGEGRTLQLDEGAEAAPPHCDWAEIMPDGSERLLIAAADPTTPSLPALDAATIERCAKVAEGWSDPAFATMHENRCFAAIAAAIRALPNAEKRHG